ncbi:GNAT family N-acetyltransferase [Camelimonas sp. ID_303_24]
MTRDNIVIRPYQGADTKLLSGIWLLASRQAHPFLGEEKLRSHRQLIESEYLPNSETWVACDQGKPVGFIGLIETFIGGLFVDPHAQGLGVGRLLVDHALTLKGSLELEVYAANEDAVRFYSRLGFSEISRREKDDEGLPFENIRMRLAG